MSRRDLTRVLIAYDIPDDRRRAQLAKCLQRHGDRVQFSVFIVDASPSRILRLRHEVASMIVMSEDSVLFCDLGLTRDSDSSRFAFVGRSRTTAGGTSRII
ncbi:MAG TPA: CRISPR-associated endonuclease Cas2 [Mycobacterium sp.]|nr:CRISPR-associated endonuclease Cas2 [Mycobacterium sp.]HQE14387.1 CRISPR-associated endonuclease Cas2 [Mycobacterium sp.]